MQNHAVDFLLADLRAIIRDLGKDDGLIGPSIYDTAQVVRLAPPVSGIWAALNWLIEQQQPDGGWGDPAIPRARDVPTLAAILALNTYATRADDRKVIQAGLTFLHRHVSIWTGTLPDDLPVGVELLLPRLLEEAQIAGLNVPYDPYMPLIALGQRRLRMFVGMPVQASTTPAHVWEAWGATPDPSLIDASGGIGHSPAATAAWLRAAIGREDLGECQAAAQRYLEGASAATGINIPGVVPTVWPITRFEQSNALYALLIGGLLDHPQLRDVVHPQIENLIRAFRPIGLGMSDCFIPDGDDTAEALAVLHAAGYPPDLGAMQRFARNNHYCAYQGELQPALSVTAHAVHILRIRGQDCTAAQEFLIERQLSDGRWSGDKWNGSWLYTTGQILVALEGAGYDRAMKKALNAFLVHQHADGGWGAHGSNAEETAYVILALRAILHNGIDDDALHQALKRAERWMLHDYRPFNVSMRPCWLGKEIYRPLRLARIIELVATVPSSEVAAPLWMTQSGGASRDNVHVSRDLALDGATHSPA